METERYKFQKYTGKSSRHHCPECGKQETFVLYIDTETNEPVNAKVGKCNRADKCGYNYTPSQYFKDNDLNPEMTQSRTHTKPIEIKPTSYINQELFFASLKGYEDNNFVKFLTNQFDIETVNHLIEAYYIGSSNHWQGSTIFYQIDTKGRIRTGKIMLYDAITGKRVKEPTNHIAWVHNAIKQPEFELKQCFFGEHLLTDKTKPVAIVESEKTALIASVYMPQFIWLAAGNLNGLTAEKCAILMGRNVILYPDLGKGFELWSAKAKELAYITKFKISELLENIATDEERSNGLDLADYLIRYDYKEFVQPGPFKAIVTTPEPIQAHEPDSIQKEFYNEAKPTLENWNSIIDDLELFFNSKSLPVKPIQLNEFTLINDIPFFIETNLSIVRAQNGKKTYLPYLNRLQRLKLCLN